jgi:hypothetical protein
MDWSPSQLAITLGGGTMSMNEYVGVPLWVVVYAIRYGMGRKSYANEEASELAKEFWSDIPEFIQHQIVYDVERLDDDEHSSWEWLTERK